MIPSESKPSFDWRAALADDDIQFPTEDKSAKGRKLSFYDQCCAFAALRCPGPHGKRRFKSQVVAKAFGVSFETASILNACLNSMSQRPHYRAVASEWNDLGQDEFMRRYYTEAVHAKCVVARYQTSRNLK